jgi:hypothetical protein
LYKSKKQTDKAMKTYTLPFSKVENPVSQKQINQICDFDNLKGCPSSSQMLKRLDDEMFEEILSDLEDGIDVIITGK